MKMTLSASSSCGLDDFLWERHVKYIYSTDTEKDTFFYFITEHLRMGGVYWGTTALDLLDGIKSMNVEKSQSYGDESLEEDLEVRSKKKEDLISWIIKCQHEEGGFGPSISHDANLVNTHYAVLVLALHDALDRINIKKLSAWIASLQNADGSFRADLWGEVDSRFTYCALSCLTILDELQCVNVEMARIFLQSCQNFDGGFGWFPGGESHAASAFCCIGGLALSNGLYSIDKDYIGWWLCERQTNAGGFNGRPEKAPDVCYSWWILASLAIIGRMDWIDRDALKTFILAAQDADDGGIADRPGDVSDVFHTFFGIAALSLMRSVNGLKEIHPVYALPIHVVKRMCLPQILCAPSA